MHPPRLLVPLGFLPFYGLYPCTIPIASGRVLDSLALPPGYLGPHPLPYLPTSSFASQSRGLAPSILHPKKHGLSTAILAEAFDGTNPRRPWAFLKPLLRPIMRIIAEYKDFNHSESSFTNYMTIVGRPCFSKIVDISGLVSPFCGRLRRPKRFF